MSEAIVRNSFHVSDIKTITIVVEWYRYPLVLESTPWERANCPPTFRCYACQEKRKKSDFAGEILHQRLCRFCSPYVDQWDVGAWIRFDLRYGFRAYVRGY